MLVMHLDGPVRGLRRGAAPQSMMLRHVQSTDCTRSAKMDPKACALARYEENKNEYGWILYEYSYCTGTTLRIMIIRTTKLYLLVLYFNVNGFALQ